MASIFSGETIEKVFYTRQSTVAEKCPKFTKLREVYITTYSRSNTTKGLKQYHDIK